MKKSLKRGLALFLSVLMCVSMLQLTVLATESEAEAQENPASSAGTVIPGNPDGAEGTEAEDPAGDGEELLEGEDPAGNSGEPVEGENPDAGEGEEEKQPEEPETTCAAEVGGQQYETLQEAVNAAEEGDTITLLENVTENITFNNKAVTLDLNGNTVSGTGSGTVVTINGGDVILTGDGEITGGEGARHGGGVKIDKGGSFTMNGGIITGNSAVEWGGGVCVDDGTFTMNDGEISGNNAAHVGGGVAVYNYLEDKSGRFTMNGGMISENNSGIGGGIGAVGSKKAEIRTVVVINDGMISGNSAKDGAGVSVKTEDPYSSGDALNRLEIKGGEISGNTAANYGGGVYTAMALANIANCEISDNETTAANVNSSCGGGIYLGNGGAELTNVSVTGNRAVQGGGVFGSGPVSLDGCEVTGNTGSEYGGGLRVGLLSHVTVENSVITGNTARIGGGVYVFGGKGADPKNTSFTMESGALYGNISTYGNGTHSTDVYSETATLTLPAIEEGLTKDGEEITGWFWDGGGNYAWSKDYVKGYEAVIDAVNKQCLVAAYDPTPKYTVTYGDGVEGETIFEDQVYVVKSGSATPAFAGEEPTRAGYTFAGWSPEVAETVTEDVTYAAQWTRNSTGGGTTTRYDLTVSYLFEDGSEAAPAHVSRHASGYRYSVTSPEIEGFTPDQAVVSGRLTGDVEITVVYTADEAEIPDEEPPLIDLPDVEIPDEEPPLVEIPEEEPPLVEVPEEEIIDEEPPLVEIPEEEVPLDSTPKTGDARRTGLWAALCGVSLCGMTALLGKKKDEEA